MRIILSTAVNGFVIWLAAAIVPGITVVLRGNSELWFTLLTYAIIGLVFALVNSLIKPIVKLLSLPLQILTLGLIGLVINAAMLALTALIVSFSVFDLQIAGFWAAFWGGVVISIANALLAALFPGIKK